VQSELQNVTRNTAALIGKQVGNLSLLPTPFATSAQKNEKKKNNGLIVLVRGGS